MEPVPGFVVLLAKVDDGLYEHFALDFVRIVLEGCKCHVCKVVYLGCNYALVLYLGNSFSELFEDAVFGEESDDLIGISV